MNARLAEGLRMARPILGSYSTTLFSQSPWVGALLLAATFYHPQVAISGLVGTIVALVASRVFGFDRVATDDGRLLFNPMLCSLGLGYWTSVAPIDGLIFGVLLPLVSISALFVTVFLNHVCMTLTGSASRSIPFCIVAIGLHWVLLGLRLEFEINHLPDMVVPGLPPVIDLWLHSISAILFSSGVVPGLFMTVALFLASRISLLNAMVGFLTSLAMISLLGIPMAGSFWLHLNAILCAVAIGGIFFIPSRAALMLAALSAAICVLVGCAMLRFLPWFDAPILTLPFNITLLAVNTAMRWREAGRLPRAVVSPGATPEETVRMDQLYTRRMPDAQLPAVGLPFEGDWVVTQGFNGGITHLGKWQYALDFEVAGENGQAARPDSSRLGDYPSCDAPITSPVAGRIVRVMDDIRDNPIGGNNLADNWGNSVVIEIGPELFLQLSHFRYRGIKVREGDRVRAGQLLGFLGNSGRSPLPHLHMQMQLSPEIGAPTIPFRLHGYIGTGRRFVFRGLPGEGELVSGNRPCRWLQESLAPAEVQSNTYRVFSHNGEDHETVVFSREADGSVLLTTLQQPGSLRGRIINNIFVPLQLSGSRHGMLNTFYLAGRIPLGLQSEVSWSEEVDGSRKGSWVAAAWAGLLVPYFERPANRVTGRVSHHDPAARRSVLIWNFAEGDVLECSYDAEGLCSGRWEHEAGWLRFNRVSETSSESTEVSHREAADFVAA